MPKFGGKGKAGLERAENAAELWSKSGKSATEEKVLEVLRLIGGDGCWPTQARPNVTETGKNVPGACFGLVFALGQGPQCSLVSQCYPYITLLLTAWVKSTLPKTRDGKSFPFSSIQVNFNYAAIRHVDGNNIGASYIISMGSHKGGQLWTAKGILDCHGQWRLFDGNSEHGTEPFERVVHAGGVGERISVIVFAHSSYNSLKPEVVAALKDMGFTAARSDGVDESFFVPERIERSYLTDEHNDAFRKCLAERAAAGQLLDTVPGDVSLECYGRQAECGGGWFAFDEQRLELTPNSTGIWLVQLAWGKTGALELVKLERFDFYANLGKAEKRFEACVAAMLDGAPVMLGIADTACAAQRPLTKGVYETLQALGAPRDMPKLQYRAAWGMIGYKGCQVGKAITAMGKRSTLLHLDGRFERAKNGETTLSCASQPELVSIVDVVTGGGQDCAVPDELRDKAPRAKRNKAGAK